MQPQDRKFVRHLLKSSAIGAGAGLALALTVIGLDLFQIGTMIANSVYQQLLLPIFLAGALAKGGLLGVTFGATGLWLGRPRVARIVFAKIDPLSAAAHGVPVRTPTRRRRED